MAKGGMVGENGEWAAFEVDLPFLECVDDGQHLLLVSGIVTFGRVHFPRDECDRLGSMALVLGEHSTESKVGSISGDHEGECRVRDAEDGGLGHKGLEFLKGFLCAVGPGVGGILVGEVSEGGGDSRVVRNKTMV